MSAKGIYVELIMAQARDVAHNILTHCARAEADAMIRQFFNKEEFPEGAAAALMREFRDFRLALDNETVESRFVDPDTGREVKPQ